MNGKDSFHDYYYFSLSEIFSYETSELKDYILV
jgi:hypothetical protein